MNRPVLSRNRWLGLALAGTGSIALAYGQVVPPIPFFVAGFLATMAGGALGIQSALQVRSLRRLNKAGEVVARWRVTPAEWQAFVVLNEEWHRQKGVYRNSLDLQQPIPSEGIEIVAGVRAVKVGEEFFDLHALCSYFQGVNWLATQSLPVLEVLGRVQTRSGSFPSALRLPVNPAEPRPAIDTHAAWCYRVLLRNRATSGVPNPLRVRNICLAMACAGLVLMLVPELLWPGVPWINRLASNRDGPMLALGFLAASFGAAIGLVVQVRYCPVYRRFLEQPGLTRWSVSAAEWQHFLRLDQTRGEFALNFLSLPRPRGATVEFVAGPSGLMVDGELFLFSVIATGDKTLRPVWLEGPPLALELHGVFQIHGTSGSFTLRFPVDATVRPALEGLSAQWVAAVAGG